MVDGPVVLQLSLDFVCGDRTLDSLSCSVFALARVSLIARTVRRFCYVTPLIRPTSVIGCPLVTAEGKQTTGKSTTYFLNSLHGFLSTPSIMECDKMETIPTPTQMFVGPSDVTDRLQHSNINKSSQQLVYPAIPPRISPSLTRRRKGKITRKFTKSQSVSQPQATTTAKSTGHCARPIDIKSHNHNRFNSPRDGELTNRFNEDDTVDTDDEFDEKLEDEDDEYRIYSSSLPVTSFIGIRPPAATSNLSLTVRQLSSSSSSGLLSLSPVSSPISPKPSSVGAAGAATASAVIIHPETSSATVQTRDCDGMGVLCPANVSLSPLEKSDSLGFERSPASPALDLNSLPLSKNGQITENLQVDGATSSACHLTTQIPKSPKKQRFTFESQHGNGFQVPSDAMSRATTCQTQNAQCQNISSLRPQLRRQLSKRKSESLLDAPPPFGEYNSDENDDDDDDEAFHSIRSYTYSDYCAPASPKARRLENFDPYQVFEVQRTPCLILTVRVLRGRNITMGLQDYYDTPDPYINLYLRTSPEGRKSTSTKENNTNPVWEEEFTFYINFTQTNVLQITLMESNLVWFDQVVGTVNFDISSIKKMDVVQKETFVFNEVSEIDIEFLLQFDSNPTLRYSLCLSDAEKKFQELRKEKVFENMRRLLGQDEGPMNLNEVPNIAVIGSGGGFRALTGYSGVFKALVESGVLDCTMYAGGLSGSSWLLSTLYSHPKWPNLDMGEFLDELMNSVDKRLLRFFTPSTMYSYAQYMVSKRREGQPVSFTDIFGKMVGETLIPGRMDATLTDQRQKLKDGSVPMPLYTCVHVKKDVPARSFQEWVEFSPYEIGLPKYGTFMDSELFGSKFFMGKLVKQYKEQPLHFLQGMWGSAFCILFKRLLEDNRRIDPAEMIRQEIKNKQSQDDLIRRELGEELDHPNSESSSDCSDDDELDYNESSFESDTDDMEKTQNTSMDSNNSVQSTDSQENIGAASMEDNPIPTDVQDGDSAYEGEEEDDEDEDDDDDDENSSFAFLKDRRCSVEMKKAKKEASPAKKGIMCSISENEKLNASDGLKKSVNWGALPVREHKQKQRHEAFARANSAMRKSRTGSMSYWKRLMKGVVESKSWEVLSTRRGRAAVIHNFMRGLSLQQTYPLSPFTPVHERVKEGDEFDGIFEMVPTSLKHIYMVDAGLTFNSPYPLMLRPQREVDIILSFDFSARPSDKHHPFKELLLAEKWANLNRLPFPPIDASRYNKDDVKELYIFKHPTDPHCPVVLHFALVNNKFKYYSKPGVPRQTKEEFDFAEFDIFNDPKAPYSTFSFTYTHESFKRLSQLTEFNTLLHINEIKEEIKAAVKRKKENPQRYRIPNKDIKLLRMKSVQAMRQKLHGFISRMGSTTHPSGSNTPLYTATPESPSTNPFFAGYKREISVPSSAGSSVFGTPQQVRDIPDFGGHAESPRPASAQRQASLNHEKERREILLSTESVYGTPPESADCLKNVENSSKLSSTTTTSASINSKEQQPSQSTLSSGSESSTPKVVVASQVRSRKESPPNPFFASFIKSKMSSQSSSSSSSSSISSPLFSDSSKNYRKDARVLRQTSRKTSPKIVSPPSDPSHPLSQNAVTKQSEPLSLSITNQSPTGMAPSVLPLTNLDGPNTGSTTSSGYSSLSEKIVEEDKETFSMAPEAFKADGTPVTDSTEAKMYHEHVKAKRKLLRRQSTVSSMNNISLDETHEGNKEEGISLEQGKNSHAAFNNLIEMSEDEDEGGLPSKVNLSRFDGNNDFMDLSQFQGMEDDNEIVSGYPEAKVYIHSDNNVIDSTKLCCDTQNQDQISLDSGTDLTFF